MPPKEDHGPATLKQSPCERQTLRNLSRRVVRERRPREEAMSKVSTGRITTKDTKSTKGSRYETLDATFVPMDTRGAPAQAAGRGIGASGCACAERMTRSRRDPWRHAHRANTVGWSCRYQLRSDGLAPRATVCRSLRAGQTVLRLGLSRSACRAFPMGLYGKGRPRVLLWERAVHRMDSVGPFRGRADS
jgi:hypothetical protein